jgi:hypothetical protein
LNGWAKFCWLSATAASAGMRRRDRQKRKANMMVRMLITAAALIAASAVFHPCRARWHG